MKQRVQSAPVLTRKLEVVGKGGYGCVVRPAPPCASGETFPESNLAKFQSRDDAQREADTQRYIKQVDRENRYTATSKAVCDVSEDVVRSVKRTCFTSSDGSDTKLDLSTKMIVFENQGVNLESFIEDQNPTVNLSDFQRRNPMFVPPMVSIFEQVFTFLDMLQRQFNSQHDFLDRLRFLHMDLNTRNILVKESPPGTLQARIIDFGTSYQLGMYTDVSKFNGKLATYRKNGRNFGYEFTPPDFLIFNLQRSPGPAIGKSDVTHLATVLGTSLKAIDREKHADRIKAVPHLDAAVLYLASANPKRYEDANQGLADFVALCSRHPQYSSFSYFPWSGIDVYQAGVDAICMSLEIARRIPIESVPMNDFNRAYLDAACAVWLQCVHWNPMRRLPARDAVTQLQGIRSRLMAK